MSNILSYLFSTNAIQFCPENKPFWYTSGKIGPYFINTHYIYGSKEDATSLLSYIDTCLENKETLPSNVFKEVLKQYEENEIYKNVIDTMKQAIESNLNLDDVDYISGGERRDWFFSNILAYLFKKSHISIYKDMSTVVSSFDFTENKPVENLEGKNVLHIADLVTVASSFVRAWVPAIENLGAKMKWTCYVVDRKQGGTEKIQEYNIQTIPLVCVDPSLFQTAYEQNIINSSQLDLLNKFFQNPDETMKQFLIEHPAFLEESLNADEKTQKRAKLLMENNLYGIF